MRQTLEKPLAKTLDRAISKRLESLTLAEIETLPQPLYYKQDEIFMREQLRDAASIKELRDIVALDTETDTSTGSLFLIADNHGNYLDGEQLTFDILAQWLLRYEGKWVFFYNLEFDTQPILKLLPHQVLKTGEDRRGLLTFEYNGYKITTLNGKKLTITKGNHEFVAYDIAQFYERVSLLNACRNAFAPKIVADLKKASGKYEESKTEENKKAFEKARLALHAFDNTFFGIGYLAEKFARASFTLRDYNRTKKTIREYCINDCIATQKLAKTFCEQFKETFGMLPKKWVSTGYMAEKVLISKKLAFPLFGASPYEAQKLALACFHGGRFETLIRGHAGHGFIYDINSAYPKIIAELPDVENGQWVQNAKEILPNAALGYFKIVADVGAVRVAPFAFRVERRVLVRKTGKERTLSEGSILFPNGRFVAYVTLPELKMIEGDKRIAYRILESWQFIPSDPQVKPWKNFVETTYKQRLDYKAQNNPMELQLKLVLNSLYGKTAQRKSGAGNLYNPIIAAHITGATRAFMYDFIQKNGLEDDVIAFATDSITVTKKLHGYDKKTLGEFKLDKEGEVIMLSNGIYAVNKVWKQRGIGRDMATGREVNHDNTEIDKRGRLVLKLKVKRTMKIKTAIRRNKLGELGLISEETKLLNLNGDTKRFWLGELTNLQWVTDPTKPAEKINSIPVNVNFMSQQMQTILEASADSIKWADADET